MGLAVNAYVKLGDNITFFNDATIGVIEDGKKGNSTIEDTVAVYANVTIGGNTTVGHSSTIAKGSFVNFNVPPNSTVIGNQEIIHK